MKPFILISVTACLVATIAASPAAQIPEPPPAVFGTGGGGSTDGTIYLADTVGQPVIGVTSGTNTVRSGYWYAVDQLNVGPQPAVMIAAFEVQYGERGVRLDWTIASADGMIGFKVYRSVEAESGFELLNGGKLLPATVASFTDAHVRPARTYWYRIGAVDRDGEFLSQVISVDTPYRAVELDQNYPNPFNPTTQIDYYLPATERVTLSVYDVQGKLVTTLVDGVVGYGSHTAEWDGTDSRGNRAGSGVYFYRLVTGNKVITKKLVMVK
jgi:hypothetical protein